MAIIGKLNKRDSVNAFLNPTGEQLSGRLNNLVVTAKWGEISGDITDQADLIEYIDQNGGKIDKILVNNVPQPIVNKTVNIHTQTVSMIVNENALEVTIQ